VADTLITARPKELTPVAASILEGLNPRQLEAVTQGDGPVLVFAGAGSGKTRVLTRRIAYLIKVRHRPPWSILAVTFTNKAAGEMRERVLDMTGKDGKDVTLGTFHAVCLRILRIHRRRAGKPEFSIFDADDQKNLMKQALQLAQIRDPRMTPGVTLSHVSKLKNELIRPEAFEPHTYTDELVGRVYPVYQSLLRQNSAYDFDDLLAETVETLQAEPEALEHYADRYQHVLVDEYQDTNHAQYVLVRMLASKHRNLFVVGDADQAIYGWRGANIRNILEFERNFPEAKTITLDQNYRSTQNILDAAHAVISVNQQRPEKRLWTDQEPGPLIHGFEARNEDEEAQFIARQIRRLVHRGATEPRSCAVMYRTNAQSRAIEGAFRHEGVPYKIVGATRFYERREVKDVLAYLRWIANPADGVSLARIVNVPPRRIGPGTVTALRDWAGDQEKTLWDALQNAGDNADLSNARRKHVDQAGALFAELREFSTTHTALEILEHVLERTQYLEWLASEDDGEARIENVNELRTVAQDFDELEPEDSLRSMLEQVALVSDADQVEESGGAATLMTMHLAKGLEFDVVFLAGMEEGVFPHSRSLDDPAQLEEERRLCYVGITRARRMLYLSYGMSRRLMGRSERNSPSRFLFDIPEELFTLDSNRPSRAERSWGGFAEVATAAPPPHITEASFIAGEKVYHKHFGVGTVIATELSGGDEEVTVMFMPKDQPVTKRLSVIYSGLEHA
jgi:DNA helicase II / ATP-dependent DNA helicase PcrA